MLVSLSIPVSFYFSSAILILTSVPGHIHSLGMEIAKNSPTDQFATSSYDEPLSLDLIIFERRVFVDW